MLGWIGYIGKYYREDNDTIASSGVSEEQAKIYKRIFDRADSRGTGTLTRQAVRKTFNRVLGPRDIGQLFTEYDTDHNDLLDFEEFARMITPTDMTIEQTVIDKVK